MLLSQKKNKVVKGRCVYNGKLKRAWLPREETTSPMAALESIFLTTMIDAKEGKDIMTNDIPNAFIQVEILECKDGKDQIIMKITGVLVDYLVKIAPEIYANYIVIEKGKRVLYVEVL